MAGTVAPWRRSVKEQIGYVCVAMPVTGEAVPPHPLLPAYYTAMAERPDFVRRLFNGTAPDYDRINRYFALGSGDWYRRRTLIASGLSTGMRVLDVAVGTGLVARQACRLVGAAGRVVGVDLSENMLKQASAVPGLALIQGRAEQLPVAGATVDLVTMGYALRHVSDLPATFQEFRRVLRPQGRVLLLEIARPTSRIGLHLARLYLDRLVPLLCGGLASGSAARKLMHYYWDTIESCVPPDTILGALSASGFRDVGCATELGMFRAYTAVSA